MAKSKTPLFSLGSQGSLANTLTTQKGSSSSILRRKPTPSDPYSLPQAYQRWLYEDYAYLWRQQSQATRAEYRSAGVRHHLTGFQYWMKHYLTNLPDIAAWWKLDTRGGSVQPDSSKNLNHATVFGASPTTLAIDGALSFDGINDRLVIADAPSIDFTTHLSISIFFSAQLFTAAQFLLSKHWDQTYGLSIENSGQEIWFYTAGLVPFTLIATALALQPQTLYHCLATFKSQPSGTNRHIYLNGHLVASDAAVGTISTNDLNLWLGSAYGTYRYTGIIDNVILYNRQLDQADALRHSERRYPPQ